MKIRPVGAELLRADGRTDVHDEANWRFSQFCESALKIQKPYRRPSRVSSRFSHRRHGFRALSSVLRGEQIDTEEIYVPVLRGFSL
jgi:hypothetical protein